jgi:hypothetical protein
MHANAWATLLRHIPPEQHGKIMVVTGSGVEVAVQNILRIDNEFMAFKGRLAGSQDQGRLFFVTFHNIDYINFKDAVQDDEFHAMFDNLEMPEIPANGVTTFALPGEETPEVPLDNNAAEEIQPEALPDVEPEPTAATPVSPSNRAPAPLKSAILERFRSRSNLPGGSNNGSMPRPTEGG